MKIAIIGPGFSEIPPKGWGACEIIVWDYYTCLTKIGHEVKIINTTDYSEITNIINKFNPDFVHCQYDNHTHVLNNFNCKKAVTTHFAYLEQPEKQGGYYHVFKQILDVDCYVFALSEGIKNTFINFGKERSKIIINHNGARSDLFRYEEQCKYQDKSLCIGKIEYRKRQAHTQLSNANVYFVGNYSNSSFNTSDKKYLGEWTKDNLYANMTEYANLVLLSDGEAHPLVTCEALISGLGLVISEYAAANLDVSLPFIDIIPNNKIDDLNYIRQTIIENRKKSILYRKDIREYALNNFDYDRSVIPRYIKNIKKII